MKVKVLCVIQYHKHVVVEMEAPIGGLPDDIYSNEQSKALIAKVIELADKGAGNVTLDWIGESYYRPAKMGEPYFYEEEGVKFEDPEWFDR